MQHELAPSDPKRVAIESYLRTELDEPEYAWGFDKGMHLFSVNEPRPRLFLRISMEFVADHTAAETTTFLRTHDVAQRMHSAASEGQAVVVTEGDGITLEPIRP